MLHARATPALCSRPRRVTRRATRRATRTLHYASRYTLTTRFVTLSSGARPEEERVRRGLRESRGGRRVAHGYARATPPVLYARATPAYATLFARPLTRSPQARYETSYGLERGESGGQARYDTSYGPERGSCVVARTV